MTSLTQTTHCTPVLGNIAVSFAIIRTTANTGHISLTVTHATSNGRTEEYDIMEAPFQAQVGARKQDLDQRMCVCVCGIFTILYK